MIRTCCICKQKQTPQSLLRLHATPEGLLRPIAKRPAIGRSLWVCLKPSCIVDIPSKKRNLPRLLRSPLSTNGFMDAVLHFLWRDIVSLINSLDRSGLIIWGTSDISSRKALYWITFAGEFAKEHKIEYFKADEKGIPSFRVTENIQSNIKVTNTIGVQSGKKSRLLQQRIKLFEHLKPNCFEEYIPKNPKKEF